MSSPFSIPDQARNPVCGFSRRMLAVLTMLAGMLVFSASAAGEAPLGFAEAQRRAVERSHLLPAQESAITASREMAVAAAALPDPVLKFGLDNLPVTTVPGVQAYSLAQDSFTARRIGIMQEFTRSEKRQLRAQRFRHEAEKSLAERTATVAAIQRDTALAWLERYYAEAMAAVIAEEIREARLEIVAAEGTYRAGRGNQADVLAAHSALVELEDRASELDRRIRIAGIGLARWVGAAADAPLGNKPAIDSIRLETGALDTQLSHHPQIAVLTKQAEITATEARVAQADKQSDWSVEVMYSQRGPAFSNLVSVGVSIPLQWDQKNRQDRELTSRLALAEQAREQRDEALRAHIAEVSGMIAEWKSGRERLARYERELIPLARERTRAALAAYLGGRASLTDLLLARRNAIDMRMQAVRLEMETARLWAQLNFLFPEDIGMSRTNFPSTASRMEESK